MPLEHCRGEKVLLRDCGYDEKWLQERIEEDPGILGLGDVVVLRRERKQSSGGKIDFLLSDSEAQMMYEVEVQLGRTDESHIIRTLEYWDIESRRFPSKNHKAVIVAEEITNRFFNVISLMNKSIPIVAIQLNVIKIDNKISLIFTKILDIYEDVEDEELLGGETVDRGYWERNANAQTIALMDEIIKVVKEAYSRAKVTYNKYHIALGTERRNFAWFHPRRREGYCYIDIKIGENNIDNVKKILEESSVQFTRGRNGVLGIRLQPTVMSNNKAVIEKIFRDACDLNR